MRDRTAVYLIWALIVVSFVEYTTKLMNKQKAWVLQHHIDPGDADTKSLVSTSWTSQCVDCWCLLISNCDTFVV